MTHNGSYEQIELLCPFAAAILSGRGGADGQEPEEGRALEQPEAAEAGPDGQAPPPSRRRAQRQPRPAENGG
jgi:hypothetical protein